MTYIVACFLRVDVSLDGVPTRMALEHVSDAMQDACAGGWQPQEGGITSMTCIAIGPLAEDRDLMFATSNLQVFGPLTEWLRESDGVT